MENYEIIKDLGKGAYGEVLLARNKETNEEVAIKAIKINEIYSFDSDRVKEEKEYENKCIEREIQSLKECEDCDNIVKLYETFKDNDNYYLVMEKCTSNLRDYINKKEPFIETNKMIDFYDYLKNDYIKNKDIYINSKNELYINDIKNILNEQLSKYNKSLKPKLTKDELDYFIYDITNALNELNSKNIIHRDLKPENILIIKNNSFIKFLLGDFGTARNYYTNGMTQRVGTPDYMSPESIASDKFKDNNNSDLFSFGCILYELIYGDIPYHITQRDYSTLENLYKYIDDMENIKIKYDDNNYKIINDLIRNLLIINPQKRFKFKEYNDYVKTKYFNITNKDIEKFNELNKSKITIYDYKIKIDKDNINEKLNILKNIKFKRLIEIDLSYCKQLTNIDALKDLKNLTNLDLSDCYQLTNIDALKDLKNLTNLYLSYCKQLTNIDALKELTNLTNLNLYGCKQLTNIDGLIKSTNLRKLNLGGCEQLTNIDGIKQLTNLRELILYYCHKLTNIDDLKKLTNLTYLNLYYCDQLTNIDALKELTNLTNLNLYECKQLTNIDGLIKLTNLTNLNLYGCKQLTNIDGLKELTNLRDLDLSYCDQLTNINGLKDLKNLTDLNLNGCNQLTNIDGLKDLKNLTDLDLSYFKQLTNIDALKDLKNLTNLDLSYCIQLTNIDALKDLKNLTNLDLYGCIQLTNIDGLKNLKNLKIHK